jgi:hypothetical protein
VLFDPDPPQATCSKHPPSTRKTRQIPRSFLRLGVFHPAALSSMAGISTPMAKSQREPCSGAGASTAWAPVVATVSIELPLLLATAVAPSEQVGAGLKVVETLQVRATVEGLRPPTGLIVMVDCPDAPGATESEAGEDDRPKSSAAAVHHCRRR